MPERSQRKPFPVHILVFLAPATLVYTLFMVYPLIDSLRLSFFALGYGYLRSVGSRYYGLSEHWS